MDKRLGPQEQHMQTGHLVYLELTLNLKDIEACRSFWFQNDGQFGAQNGQSRVRELAQPEAFILEK